MRVFTLRDKRPLYAAAAPGQTGIPVANLFGLVISAHSDFRINSLPHLQPAFLALCLSRVCGGLEGKGLVSL